MTEEKIAEHTVKHHEKPAHKSKKFAAFALTEIGFFVVMILMIWKQDLEKLSQNLAFMTIAVTAGFLAVGYILGQAYTDRYVRVALITMGRGDALDKLKENQS